MSVGATIFVAGLAILAAVACGWLGARPAKALGPPRLVPWRLLMLIFFALSVAAIGHLVAVWRGS
jgi:hypothetical protein